MAGENKADAGLVNMKKPDVIKRTVVLQQGHTIIVNDRLRFPSGTEGQYLYVERDTSVAIIPIFEEKDGLYTLLVKQYRYPIRQAVYQFPMGFAEHGVSHEDQARKELREETGYKAGKMQQIGEFFHDPGLNTQRTVVFLALNPTPEGNQQLDATEDIEVKKVSVGSLSEKIKRGEICDALTLTLVYKLEHYLSHVIGK